MSFMKVLFLIMMFLTVSACSSNTDSGVYKKSENIDNRLSRSIPELWKEISSEGSDYALQKITSNSIFLFNSSCRKFEGSSLNALTGSILTGLDDLIIEEKKESFYQGREAVEVTANGKLDGITRYFKIITILKNNCIYDYVLIATNQSNLQNDSADLKSFLERIIIN